MFWRNLYEVIYGYSESTIPSESEENVKKINRQEDKPEMSRWIWIKLSAGILNFGQKINLKCPGASESNYMRVFRIFALDRMRATEGPDSVECCKMAVLGSFPFLLDLPLLPGFWGILSILRFLGDGTCSGTFSRMFPQSLLPRVLFFRMFGNGLRKFSLTGPRLFLFTNCLCSPIRSLP